jgi:HK97 gp10 family phage protein
VPVNVKVIGLEKLQRKLGANLTEPARRDIMRQGGLLAEKEAELKAPRDTGALVRSLSLTSNENMAKVSTGVYYARFLEHGTSRMKPRRFMARAKAVVSGKLKGIIEEAARRIERAWAA